MKKVLVSTLLGVILSSMLLLAGCTTTQPGETAAEGHRRHLRMIRIQNEQMNADIDSVLLTDQPSSLSPYRIK